MGLGIRKKVYYEACKEESLILLYSNVQGEDDEVEKTKKLRKMYLQGIIIFKSFKK